MHVLYHPHARRRMRERIVSGSEVDTVLKDYDTDLPAKKGRRNRYKMINHRRIRVTFEMLGEDEYFVWTVTADEVGS